MTVELDTSLRIGQEVWALDLDDDDPNLSYRVVGPAKIFSMSGTSREPGIMAIDSFRLEGLSRYEGFYVSDVFDTLDAAQKECERLNTCVKCTKETCGECPFKSVVA